MVYVGALCQPAKDPGRLDPCVQRWKASIEASVIIGDFLNTPQERGLKRVLEILCGELPGRVSALELLFSLRCGFAQTGRVWDAWAGLGWAGRAAGPGGLSQRQLTARGAEHAPQGSARATPPGTSPNSTRVLSILGVPPCTFAPVFCPAGVRPSGPNRGSPALAEEHRQERERFPWKPLDAQQQVADSCHVTRCINQKCCMNQVRWGQSPARSLSAALLITEPQGLLRVRGGKQLKIIKSNSDLSCRGF